MASIYKTADGNWRAQVRKRGVTKSATFPRKSEATAWAAQIESALSSNAGTITAPASMTLADVITAYSGQVKTGRTVQANLKRATGMIGKTTVRNLSAITFQTFISDRLKDGASGQTIAGDLSALSSVLRWARRAKTIDINEHLAADARRSLTARKLGTRSNKRDRMPTADEFEAVLANLKTTLPVEEIARFAKVSAMRLSEITSIYIEDISWNQSYVRLRHRKSPTGRDTAANVPVIDEGMAILRKASQGRSEGLLWPYNSRSIGTAWRNAAKRAGLAGLRFHDLRRAATTDLAKLGLSTPILRTVTGHQSIASLENYLAIDTDDFHAAYRKAKEQ